MKVIPFIIIEKISFSRRFYSKISELPCGFIYLVHLAKFSEELTFIIPWYGHARVHIRGYTPREWEGIWKIKSLNSHQFHSSISYNNISYVTILGCKQFMKVIPFIIIEKISFSRRFYSKISELPCGFIYLVHLAKFSEELTFIIPWYGHARVHIRGYTPREWEGIWKIKEGGGTMVQR